MNTNNNFSDLHCNLYLLREQENPRSVLEELINPQAPRRPDRSLVLHRPAPKIPICAQLKYARVTFVYEIDRQTFPCTQPDNNSVLQPRH